VVRGSDAATAAGRPGAPFGGPAGQVRGGGRVPIGNVGGEEGGEGGEGGLDASGESLAEAREVRPGNWEIPTSEKDHITQNAREILDSVGVEDYNEGSIQGLKITSLPGDSLPAQRGFQEGDVVKSVNGQPISSQSDLINYAKKMGDRLTVVRVEYYRQGKLMSTVYRVK
jgi:S1-C subfamily serine protease